MALEEHRQPTNRNVHAKSDVKAAEAHQHEVWNLEDTVRASILRKARHERKYLPVRGEPCVANGTDIAQQITSRGCKKVLEQGKTTDMDDNIERRRTASNANEYKRARHRGDG